MLAFAVGLGAAAGAVLRYLVDQAVSRRRAGTFPAGTWLINITGSLLLGLLAGLATHHGLAAGAVAIIGTGVCGGYTTFSTFGYETVRLMEEGSGLVSLANLAGSVAAGLAAAALGLGIGLL
ncbi:fluoride efflux transporter CrcB [Actinocrinis puniceicyclus]|uniref:Fluoride-specific ion channel FluC n=1 Tax=Actinocrinis puniceicyclus TaxID=977794 RepID=A0A8J7WQB1_9ACTN|nr:fluoride efflux transporter CrcB [Actinocrinis puniceicyclus]MBS2965568.1 fluoride efflux transporter CrcB [Actinocrinis puniceicyclus]